MSLPDLVTIFSTFNIIGSAIGISIGTASNEVIKTLTDGVVMPLLSIFVKRGDLEKYVLRIGKIEFRLGELLGNFIYFLLVVLTIVVILKYVLGGMINRVIEAKIAIQKENLDYNRKTSMHINAIRNFNVPI